MPRLRSIDAPARRPLRPAVLDLMGRGGGEPEDERGSDEEYFLSELRAAVDRSRSPAEDLVELYHGPWAGCVDRIYARYDD